MHCFGICTCPSSKRVGQPPLFLRVSQAVSCESCWSIIPNTLSLFLNNTLPRKRRFCNSWPAMSRPPDASDASLAERFSDPVVLARMAREARRARDEMEAARRVQRDQTEASSSTSSGPAATTLVPSQSSSSTEPSTGRPSRQRPKPKIDSTAAIQRVINTAAAVPPSQSASQGTNKEKVRPAKDQTRPPTDRIIINTAAAVPPSPPASQGINKDKVRPAKDRTARPPTDRVINTTAAIQPARPVNPAVTASMPSPRDGETSGSASSQAEAASARTVHVERVSQGFILCCKAVGHVASNVLYVLTYGMLLPVMQLLMPFIALVIGVLLALMWLWTSVWTGSEVQTALCKLPMMPASLTSVVCTTGSSSSTDSGNGPPTTSSIRYTALPPLFPKFDEPILRSIFPPDPATCMGKRACAAREEMTQACLRHLDQELDVLGDSIEETQRRIVGILQSQHPAETGTDEQSLLVWLALKVGIPARWLRDANPTQRRVLRLQRTLATALPIRDAFLDMVEESYISRDLRELEKAAPLEDTLKVQIAFADSASGIRALIDDAMRGSESSLPWVRSRRKRELSTFVEQLLETEDIWRQSRVKYTDQDVHRVVRSIASVAFEQIKLAAREDQKVFTKALRMLDELVESDGWYQGSTEAIREQDAVLREVCKDTLGKIHRNYKVFLVGQ
ncbi:hypothetical protein QBC39DRAFT_360339 [Podospora conica]|nr:hypothetical protein QBC39DRAFT_360339 [Schizothecium conicum]